MLPSKTVCHICRSASLRLFPGYEKLARVSSDCSPFRAGGKLGVCMDCGCTQNPTDKQWHIDTNEIYNNYAIYHQSADSNEQNTFDDSGDAAPRSQRVLQKAAEYLDYSSKGHLLDFGCGNGALLKTFSKLAPSWTMTGYEQNARYEKQIQSIERVASFQHGDFDSINGSFDLITMIHVLEHLPNPIDWLRKIRQRLSLNGFLVVQLPDAAQTPFDLVVADHCTHFTLATLGRVIEQAGYELVVATDDWLSRELSVLARPQTSTSATQKIRDKYSPEVAVKWLEEIAASAKKAAQQKPFGIFGSSITATWLYAILDGKVDFFVDEDTDKIGQSHLDKPILGVDDVPPGSNVFIGMASAQGSLIAQRLEGKPFKTYAPPSFSCV